MVKLLSSLLYKCTNIMDALISFIIFLIAFLFCVFILIRLGFGGLNNEISNRAREVI